MIDTGSNLPAVIGAAGAVAAAAIAAFVAWREQSNKAMLRKIRHIVEHSDERTLEAFKQALREVVGSDARKRRWYE